MKLGFRTAPIRFRRGFSLVETTMALGILSFAVLTLAPLLGLGLTSARQARDHQVAAQIAETLADQAQEGTLAAGTLPFDDQGEACASGSACYRASVSESDLPGNCTRTTIQVIAVNSPSRPFVYAVVLPKP